MDVVSTQWPAVHHKRRSGILWAYFAHMMARAGIASDLHVRDAKDRLVAGNPGILSPRVVVRVNDPMLPLKLLVQPSLVVGEAYMDGRIEIVSGSLRCFLEIAAKMLLQRHRELGPKLINRLVRAASPAIRPGRAARNARHHYDLPIDLYRLFLDEKLQYSCAYFREGTETLDEAQVAKIAHIAAKLDFVPGQSLLDIGCGWGTLALSLAEAAGVTATGITLSPEQCEEARRLAATSTAAVQCRFELADYRNWSERHDRIVSVGMLEHVGRARLRAYFRQVARLLKPGGAALIQSIGRWDGETGPDPWSDRYIFPGGHIPSLSEVIPAIEDSGLKLLDVEILRLHYAMTVQQWSARFADHRDKAQAIMGERFCRMWEFYLASAETGFRIGQLMVFQLLLAHERDALPLTRDYVCENENRWIERLSATN